MSENVILQLFVMFGSVAAAIIVTIRLMVKSNESLVREFAQEHVRALRESIQSLIDEQRSSHRTLLEELHKGNREVVQEIRALVNEVGKNAARSSRRGQLG